MKTSMSVVGGNENVVSEIFSREFHELTWDNLEANILPIFMKNLLEALASFWVPSEI